jgi:hypothetical protein
MLLPLKAAAICLGLYLVALVLSFVSEVTYKKRSIHDVRQGWRVIVIQTSIIFAVFVVASIVWNVLGLKGE